MNEDNGDDGLWFAEQVAAECGIEPRTVVVYAGNSRRKLAERQRQDPEAGLDPWDFPLPVATVKVSRHHKPKWRPADITTYLEHRRGPGGHPDRHSETLGRPRRVGA